ncbi:MAG: translation elongation factor Ts [Polyangiaceae bacterium]
MGDITPVMIKELRERTQAGMSDCKMALAEASGDMEAAVEIILKKGLVKAAKTAGKVASEGEVRTMVAADGKSGTIVEVNCQTDFVSRGDQFREFVGKVLEAASTAKAGSDLGTAKYPGTDRTIEDVRLELAGKIGENIVIRRWDSLSVSGNGFVHAYIHMGGKNAALVGITTGNADAAKNADVKAFADNISMQIVAMRPLVVDKAQVVASTVDKQKEIFQAQLKEEGKPEAAWPKIIEGKVAKWFTEVTLLGQDNVWEPGAGTIEKLRAELAKKVGTDVTIASFVRFELGEGIEKKTEDLAAEVAKTIGN